MIDAKDAVIWVNDDTHEVMVRPHRWGCPEDHKGHERQFWCDPIGAAFSEWQEAKNVDRMRLMLETAIDLTMQGYSMATVLRAFAEVREFKVLGRQSYPMCRALTAALLGRCLEPITMSFDELLVNYAPERSGMAISKLGG
jgi:hypothetical protein